MELWGLFRVGYEYYHLIGLFPTKELAEKAREIAAEAEYSYLRDAEEKYYGYSDEDDYPFEIEEYRKAFEVRKLRVFLSLEEFKKTSEEKGQYWWEWGIGFLD